MIEEIFTPLRDHVIVPF